MNLTESYIKFISVCDKHMLRHEYKEAFLVLTQVKYWIEKENDPTFDNDFNSRAAFCALLFGQPEEALRLTEMVNLNTPGYLLVQAFRGWALKEIGYQKRANVLFNYVLSMAPDTDSVMDCLGAAISSKLIGSELSKVFFEFTIEKFGTLTGSDRQLNLIWGIFAYLKKSELETVKKAFIFYYQFIFQPTFLSSNQTFSMKNELKRFKKQQKEQKKLSGCLNRMKSIYKIYLFLQN